MSNQSVQKLLGFQTIPVLCLKKRGIDGTVDTATKQANFTAFHHVTSA